ncbi:MAG: penicillin-binding protein 2 [Candidatus Paceibacterota bacterium]
MPKQSHVVRIRIIGTLIILFTILLGTRLFFLQVVHGQNYAERADRQYLKSARTFFDRGSIYFTDKKDQRVPAATLKQEFLITMNPQLVNNPSQTFNLLKAHLPDLVETKFTDSADSKDKMYAEVAMGVGKTAADNITALDLKGIYIHKEKKRFYPTGKTASHVLGFMAYRGEDYTGIYGLEKGYDKVLSHREQGSFASFFAEVFLGLGSGLVGGVVGEGDIILSIEPVVQHTIEGTLKTAVEKWGAESGGIVVMDPHTGRIISMAAWPDFHPGEKIGNIQVLPNPLVERVFEVGSVVKPLTLAAGIDAGVVNSNTTYYDQGFVELSGKTIRNHDKVGHGVVSMQEVINKSLNTGAVFVMQKLGQKRFRDYFLEGYGFGDKTNIDLPGEVSSLVGNLKGNVEVEFATASFGQGLALSPIAITRAFGVLASGGNLMQPQVVTSIKYNVGVEKDIMPVVQQENVLSKKAIEETTAVMVEAVDTALMGGTLSLPYYSVAAKTGTAQISDGRGGYFTNKFLHSFAGFYPAYKPRFVTFMYLIDPKGVQYSSDTLARPFMDTAEFLLNYYEVSPDRTPTTQTLN